MELRYWQGSLLERIQAFLQKHDPKLNLNLSTLKTLLHQGKFLLLIDGLNELPSDQARREVATFRQDHSHTPMVFTTRELSSGGNLGIDKRLEMQLLNEKHMGQFVQAYLPEKGEKLLRQLKEQLKEFGKTPLLLWMLCELFRVTEKIPENLGLVFRQFTKSYENHLKEDVPVQENSRQWWPNLLQHLAAVMMEPARGGSPVELRVALGRGEVLQTFVEFFQGKVAYPDSCARGCLKDLLQHHLIQINGDKIEFRHQLLQEYYAAEWLLPQLSKLSDRKLLRDYLNYLKWTEPLALMLALVRDGGLAVRVVRLALDVDLMLGTRLSGTVQFRFQGKTVGFVLELELPPRLRVECLAKTVSEIAIPELIQALSDQDYYVRRKAAEALGKLGSKAAILALIKAMSDKNGDMRREAAKALGKLGGEAAILALIQVLSDKNGDVRREAAKALRELGSEAAIPTLIQALSDQDYYVRRIAAEALGKLGSKAAIPALIQALSDQDYYVRGETVKALRELGGEVAIPDLIQALSDQDYYVRWEIAAALGKLGGEAAITALIQAMSDKNDDVRKKTVQALGRLGGVEMGEAKPLKRLWQKQLKTNHLEIYPIISGIQNCCQFYNYEITQLTLPEDKPPSPSDNKYQIQAQEVKIFEKIEQGYHEYH